MDFDNFITILEINDQRFGMINHKAVVQSHALGIPHGISDNFLYFLASAHKKIGEDLSLKIKITNSDKAILWMIIEKPKVEY